MNKDFWDIFYLKYNSRTEAAVLQGTAKTAYTDYNPFKIKLVYRRDEEEPATESEIINAAEETFFSKHFKMDSEDTVILNVRNAAAIEALNQRVSNIINLNKINDVKSLNIFLREVNFKIPVYGLFGFCLESRCIQKKKIFGKLPPLASHLVYIFHFIFHRFFAKLPVTHKIYLWLTGGKNRVMSKTEAMGRLYAHGFERVDETRIGDKYYFVFHKIKKPLINHVPTYGIIFKMLRKGKDGKLIYVYKMRTMDAYSEYLQQYVYEQNNLDKGGKFKDDFRVSTLGKFLRKYWIDELPMIINLLKGDIKLVGVRPLSAHYLSLYSGALRERRSRHKPGLIPPFYADMPETISQIMASEMNYLYSYEKNPLKTEVKYFFRILYKIVFKRARSK